MTSKPFYILLMHHFTTNVGYTQIQVCTAEQRIPEKTPMTWVGTIWRIAIVPSSQL